MKVVLAQARGVGAGVVRDVETVDRAVARRGAPVFLRHAVEHNRKLLVDVAKRT